MATEQTKNDSPNVTPLASKDADAGKYQRSTIEFPYNDLDSAVEIARAIASNAGVSCTVEQLAAYLKKAVSGPFRVMVSSARMFGITKNERGQVQLTDIGRMAADPKTEAAARVEAFLSVELYNSIFEKYRKFTLPGSKGLESEMETMGVSSKQVDKARQTFMRSAKQAGFFAHGEDRLVRPSVGQSPLTRPAESRVEINHDETHGDKGGKRSGDEPPNTPRHPFIEGLLKTLPEPDTEWPAAARAKWLQTAANIFDLIYKGDGGIEIRSAMANRSPRPNE
jgi:hypothetical protein